MAYDDLFEKTITRWVGPDGRRCKPRTEGGTKKTEQSRKWYGLVKGEPTPLSADKSVAATMLRQLRAKADLASVGLANPFEEHNKKALAEHLEEFRGTLRAKGDTEQHVTLTGSRLEAMFAACDFVYPPDLDAFRVSSWLTTLRADGEPITVPHRDSFTLGEVAALLKVKPGSVSKAVQRGGLAASGNGWKRRFPRATVEALADRAGRGLSARERQPLHSRLPLVLPVDGPQSADAVRPAGVAVADEQSGRSAARAA